MRFITSFFNLASRKRKIVTLAFLGGILCLSFWIRLQGTSNIPAGHFIGNDAYFYYWQASVISEHGHLPKRDMHRWLPLGRDLGQTLNLYGYILAYAHKAVGSVFSNVTLYQVCLYMPPICFCIGLGALCLYLYHAYGLLFSCSVGVLLATLPGTIERSATGFADRDSWCLMLGILAIITYLTSLQARHPRHRLLWTLVSGFIVFLGGLSWEGFGVFMSVILVVELWRFLSTETEEGLPLYLLWVLTFVPTLYLASPAYRNGYGFAEHLFAFVLVPPLVHLAMRTIRHLLLTKVEKLRPYARTLSLGLTLASIAIALISVFIQFDSFADTTVLSNENKLMQTVGELRAPDLKYWGFRYGSTFILGSIGLIITSTQSWNRNFLLIPPFLLFTMTTFFRDPLEKFLWNESQNTLFFAIIITYCVIIFLLAARLEKKRENHHLTIAAFTAWFLIWGALARDARRYDLFLGVSLAFFTTETIRYMVLSLCKKIWHSKYITDTFRQDVPRLRLKNILALVLLGSILFYPHTGGHALRAPATTRKMRQGSPGDRPVVKAFQWMKDELPHTAVVASNWRYGSMINVLGGVKTIIDQDHYIQNWIYLYNRHVLHAPHVQEALEFLKTHQATHLMIANKHPPKYIRSTPSFNVFVPIFPTSNFEKSMVKVWEIHYPPDIETNPKYLKTGFPEIDETLGLH